MLSDFVVKNGSNAHWKVSAHLQEHEKMGTQYRMHSMERLYNKGFMSGKFRALTGWYCVGMEKSEISCVQRNPHV